VILKQYTSPKLNKVPTQSCIFFSHHKYTSNNVKMLAIATTSNGFASNQDATLHGVKKNQTI
jgi:hypothetical protein